MSLLNQYSMILYNTTLVITGGKLVRKNTKQGNGELVEEKVKCMWQTHGCGDFL
jgi:hypothetical protein